LCGDRELLKIPEAGAFERTKRATPIIGDDAFLAILQSRLTMVKEKIRKVISAWKRHAIPYSYLVEIGLEKVTNGTLSLDAVLIPKFCRLDRVCRVITFAFTNEKLPPYAVIVGIAVLFLSGVVTYTMVTQVASRNENPKMRRFSYLPIRFPPIPTPPSLNLTL